MAKSALKITLHPSRDIPLDCLVLSQSNVRRVKAGVSIDRLADSIARRGLLQSLYVRPILDLEGQETGRYEIPAGGRRFRALELLAKQKRLAKDAPIPCVVRAAANDILAEEDSLVENSEREQLHPLDEFRGMKAMVDKGSGVEEIAARFHTSAAAVRQRLKLAGVSPKLHDLYADEAMTLDQLMAFTVSDDHERQEEVWDQLEHSFRTPAHIRQKLTENSVRAQDMAGLADRTDFHWGRMLRAALVSTLLGVGAELGTDSDDRLVRALRSGTQDSVAETGRQLVERELRVPPTLTIRPGAALRVLVTRDLIVEAAGEAR